MCDEIIHVEVYLKRKDKTDVSYEIEDKDDVVLFSTFILVFNNLGELKKKKEILFIPPYELKKRFKLMKKKFLVVPENIEYKINCLVKHRKKRKNL